MVIFNKKIKIFMSEGLGFVEAQELCQKEISLFFSSIQYLHIKSIYFAYTFCHCLQFKKSVCVTFTGKIVEVCNC